MDKDVDDYGSLPPNKPQTASEHEPLLADHTQPISLAAAVDAH